MTALCVQCGSPIPEHGYPLPSAVVERYCSVRCARLQLATLRELMNSTPHRALGLPEWHVLGTDLASDLERLAQLTVAP